MDTNIAMEDNKNGFSYSQLKNNILAIPERRQKNIWEIIRLIRKLLLEYRYDEAYILFEILGVNKSQAVKITVKLLDGKDGK